MKKRKALILSVIMMVMMCCTVVAQEREESLVSSSGETVGTAVFKVHYDNGMRDCLASTNPKGTAKYSYTKVLATYTDSSEDVNVEGPLEGNTYIYRNYEWTEDYVVTHRVWKTTASLPLKEKVWSDN